MFLILTKYREITIAFFMVVFLSACGGGGSSSGGGNGNVSYSVDPTNGPICRGESSKTDVGELVSCAWNCAVNNITSGENKGVRGLWVVQFRRSNNEWSLFNESVRTPCP